MSEYGMVVDWEDIDIFCPGRQVRNALAKFDRSVDWLAEKAELNPEQLKSVVDGKLSASDGIWYKIAEVLGEDGERFIDGQRTYLELLINGESGRILMNPDSVIPGDVMELIEKVQDTQKYCGNLL